MAFILRAVLFSLLLAPFPGHAGGEFVAMDPWPDTEGTHINAHGGGVLHHEGRYYWFGEHKTEGRRGNQAWVGVRCYSSEDLLTWKNEGVVLPVSDRAGSEIEAGCIIERPKVIHNKTTGKFVLWFHLELKGQGYKAARTAVAIADLPTGPYHYLRSFRPNAGHWPIGFDPARDKKSAPVLVRDFQRGQMSRDMTVFVDDDGKAYHIAASEENQTLHVSLLTDNYLAFTGKYLRVGIGRSHEAPAIVKQNGRYWMITSGCSGWEPNAARSMVADRMAGPWKEIGNPCTGTNPDNNLGPEKTFGGQSTFLLPVAGKPDTVIAMFDVWRPKNAIDGRYLWLPVEFGEDQITVRFEKRWSPFSD